MTILIFLAVLLVLVLVHELGHFWAAKRSGIRVEEFGFGFPPKIVSRTYGETEYSINALPFGGFVRLRGEDPESAQTLTPEEQKGSFSRASLRAQAFTLFAGPFMNLLFAWALFSLCFMFGMPSMLEAGQHTPDERLVIVGVLPQSPAEGVLKENDSILSLRRGGEVRLPKAGEALLPNEVSAFVQGGHVGEVLELDILRRGIPHTVSLVPRTGVSVEQKDVLTAGFSLARVGTEKQSFLSAWWVGVVHTVEMTKEITVGLAHFIAGIFKGTADFSKVAGPVGIAGFAGDAASLGLPWLLSFAALLSINLGVLNLLPFPALDGGRLVLVCVEAVLRRPLPTRAVSWINGVGFVFLLVLMLVITVRDILRLSIL